MGNEHEGSSILDPADWGEDMGLGGGGGPASGQTLPCLLPDLLGLRSLTISQCPRRVAEALIKRVASRSSTAEEAVTCGAEDGPSVDGIHGKTSVLPLRSEWGRSAPTLGSSPGPHNGFMPAGWRNLGDVDGGRADGVQPPNCPRTQGPWVVPELRLQAMDWIDGSALEDLLLLWDHATRGTLADHPGDSADPAVSFSMLTLTGCPNIDPELLSSFMRQRPRMMVAVLPESC